MYGLIESDVVEKIIPFLSQFMPTEETKLSLAKNLGTGLKGLSVDTIGKVLTQKVFPQIRSTLFKDWSETDMYNRRNPEFVKLIEEEKKMLDYLSTIPKRGSAFLSM